MLCFALFVQRSITDRIIHFFRGFVKNVGHLLGAER
jgi:hypothetical protein